jgi:hypothetical protein
MKLFTGNTYNKCCGAGARNKPHHFGGAGGVSARCGSDNSDSELDVLCNNIL